MMEPVACWNGDLEGAAIVTRAALGPVAKFSDSEIDKLYAALVSLEEGGKQGSEEAERLAAKIRAAEADRSAEMLAFFARTGASIDVDGLQELLVKVDKVLGT